MALADVLTSDPSSDVELRARWLARSLAGAELAPVMLDDIDELAGHATEQRVAGGTKVFSRGEKPDHVYVLVSGAIELRRRMKGRDVTLKILRPGDPFGDVPLLLRQSEPFDAQAIEDSVVLSIDSLIMNRLLGTYPRLARRWLVTVSERMRETQERVSDLLAGPLEAQIASLLLHQPGLEVDLSQDTVARLLGVNRTSVNQALKRMAERGLVETRYRHIAVTDPSGLEQLIEVE